MKQTVICTTRGQRAVITLLEESGNRVTERLCFCGFVGENGARRHIYEGSGRTPKGLFRIGRAFGYPDPPCTALPLLHIDENTHYVDDPDSPFYNRAFHGYAGGSLPFCHSERMWEIPGYVAGFVIEYNLRPVIPGRGSAIFFHVGDKPTKGCIAAPRESVEQLLYWLNPSASPQMIIQ